jgi:CheY-like chemotaxis protein
VPAHPLRVLVVEDNPDGAETLAAFLRLIGHAARVAPDGPAGLAMAQAEAPDAVLLDIGLPRIDGFEVARRLRSLGLPRRPLLIAVTGYGTEEDRRRGREAGIDLHLLKPADPEELAEALERHARASAQPGAGTDPPPRPPAPAFDCDDAGRVTPSMPRAVSGESASRPAGGL